MPTFKKRINVTLSDDMALFLQKIAFRDDVPQATKASELLQLAMEIEEDGYLSAIADERAKDTCSCFISHEKFWSSVL
jgi:predicted DNA-binding protein